MPKKPEQEICEGDTFFSLMEVNDATAENVAIVPTPINTGEICVVEADGTVKLDWGKIESAATRRDLPVGSMVDHTCWALARVAIAVRDGTWKSLNPN